MFELLAWLRARRWAALAVINLRILLGFAFLPAGLKKVLGQPFTDADKSGAFHDFLDAFLATGFFYTFVGVCQLAIAALLLAQLWTTLAAALALPVFTAIMVFCWSTGAYPTAATVTLMWLGTLALLAWDFEAVGPLVGWRPVPASAPAADLVEVRLWRACGLAILAVYVTVCAIEGGIYRPRGVELGNPSFYLLPLVALFPPATFLLERSARRRRDRRKIA